MGLVILATTMDMDLDNSAERITSSILRPMLTSSRGAYDLLASDPYILANPTNEQLNAARRWVQALEMIAPGRPASPLQGLVRTAAGRYRAGIKRYIVQLATANGRTLSNEETERLVRAHGARRLAAIAEAAEGA